MLSPLPSATRLSMQALTALMIVLLPSAMRAQHSAASAPSVVAPREGAQFDFLVGQWELVGQPQATTLAQRLHGATKLPGTWKAWRALDGWGIEDELRLTDASGNPLLLSHSVRYFDSAARRWTISAVDVYKGVVSSALAEWKGGEMIVSGSGKDAEGKAYISRGTFSKITPTGFTYRLDRSYDGGKKWTEGVTRIDAKRVAASAPR
ncbi:MAG: hypothetical protein ABMA00_00570 [Gemmatimonas sp.]